MNPFLAHSQNMAAYQAMCSEPVDASVQENTILVGGNTYPAVVGQFIKQDVLVEGGVQQHKMGEVIVQKSVLPAGMVFVFGQKVTATQIGGTVHSCVVFEAHDTYAEWRLQLKDVSEGA